MQIKVRGKKKLQGTIEISGAKNSAVAVIPAAILSDGEVIIRNIPNIDDVKTLIAIMQEIGYDINFQNNILVIIPPKRIHYNIKSELVKKLRGSYYFMGSFLGKIKKIKIFSSGGCNLGLRPINYHLDSFQKLGAKVLRQDDLIILKAKKLIGTKIDLEFPSVGATINIMLTAVKAKGVTTINNAAIEPEIIDIGNFLRAMGAIITGLGTSTIIIEGVKKLNGCDYTITSDRIEAGTYLILGAICEGKGVTVHKVNPSHLISLTDLLIQIGCDLTITENAITITKTKPLTNFNITTKPYPGFPTDLGQLITVLMLTIDGESSLRETIFLNRFSHVEELNRMGADIMISEDTIHVSGPKTLKSAKLYAYDLRGAASLILAATLNKGITYIDNIEVLLRGYEKPIEKLKSIGLNIQIIE